MLNVIAGVLEVLELVRNRPRIGGEVPRGTVVVSTDGARGGGVGVVPSTQTVYRVLATELAPQGSRGADGDLGHLHFLSPGRVDTGRETPTPLKIPHTVQSVFPEAERLCGVCSDTNLPSIQPLSYKNRKKSE